MTEQVVGRITFGGGGTYTGTNVTWADLQAQGRVAADATPEDVLLEIIEEALAKMSPRRRRRAIAGIHRMVRDAARRRNRARRAVVA